MDEIKRKLILVANPGSASRKYALYRDDKLLVSFHFEFVDGKVICTIINSSGKEKKIDIKEDNFSLTVAYLVKLLYQTKILSPKSVLDAIGIRVVAPSELFTGTQLVNGVIIAELAKLKKSAPLHIGTTLDEIRELKRVFGENTPIIAVSDSEFHRDRRKETVYYGVDTEIADYMGIKRYGYHGLSVKNAIENLYSNQKNRKKYEKVIVAHLGSGSSLTAVKNGKSVDTSMGYSPLEGLTSATRSGTIDISAALALKKTQSFDDEELEVFLNKWSGLRGVSGSSDDIRILQEAEKNGDERATLALDLMTYKIVGEFGRLAAVMGGVDALIFTGTVGERSFMMRERIVKQLGQFGFILSKTANNKSVQMKNIGDRKSKPIFIIKADENRQIIKKVNIFM